MISGKAINSTIDANGNIKVETEYTLTDGSKKTGYTRYSAFNFSTVNIAKDIKAHCEKLMVKTYSLKKNQELIQTDLSGLEHDCSSVVVVTKQAVLDKDGNVVTPAETITVDDK